MSEMIDDASWFVTVIQSANSFSAFSSGKDMIDTTGRELVRFTIKFANRQELSVPDQVNRAVFFYRCGVY